MKVNPPRLLCSFPTTRTGAVAANTYDIALGPTRGARGREERSVRPGIDWEQWNHVGLSALRIGGEYRSGGSAGAIWVTCAACATHSIQSCVNGPGPLPFRAAFGYKNPARPGP